MKTPAHVVNMLRRHRAMAIALAALALALAVALICCGLDSLGIDIAWLQARQQQLLAAQAASPLLFIAAFFGLFTLLSALALPGCGVLALAAGMCFGMAAGTLMVVVASALGASTSFLIARHFLRDRVQRRWGARLEVLQDSMSRNGALTLFSLRLVPIVPYPLINPLMGLTSMRVGTFFVVSVAGMLAGSAAYVQAGTDLARWGAGGSFWSWPLMLMLCVVALLPWLVRWVWSRWPSGLPAQLQSQVPSRSRSQA